MSRNSNCGPGNSGKEHFECNVTKTLFTHTLPDTSNLGSPIRHGISGNGNEASGSCTVNSSSVALKNMKRRQRSMDKSTSSLAPEDQGQSSTHALQDLDARSARNGCTNLHFTLISDVQPSGCYTSDSGGKRSVAAGQRLYDEGSSTRAEVMSGSTSRARSGSAQGWSILFPEPRRHQASTSPSSYPASEDGMIPIRDGQGPSGSGETRVRLPNRGDSKSLSLAEPSATSQSLPSQLAEPHAVFQRSSRPLEMLLPHNIFEQQRSRSEAAHNMTMSHSGDRSAQIFRDTLGGSNDYEFLSMEEITELFSAFDMIEEQEELSYEQLLVLESSLFPRGFSFHDQHRDMRLDIDNMSYEELLALEERVGTVNTALTGEALSRCVKKRIHTSASFVTGVGVRGDSDFKCSICQEEYAVRDKIGELACEHQYHLACICQWLRLQSWCPICKSPATPS